MIRKIKWSRNRNKKEFYGFIWYRAIWQVQQLVINKDKESGKEWMRELQWRILKELFAKGLWTNKKEINENGVLAPARLWEQMKQSTFPLVVICYLQLFAFSFPIT